MNKYYTDERAVQIIISVLKANNIKKVIASPGATNVTFIGSIQNDPWFEIYSSVDERSAAYMACGLAAESREPVVLTCTGATASRNYMPGLTEAYYRKLPVIAITAHQGGDRIGHLVAQNIDRSQTPRDIVRLSIEAPFVRDAREEHRCMIDVNRAVLEVYRAGGGPVHINCITRYSRNYSVQELPPTNIIRRYTHSDQLPQLPPGRIAIFIGAHHRMSEVETRTIDAFCGAYDAVAFCDHTSGYYGKYRVQAALKLVQEDDSVQRGVDLLIHIGEVSGDYASMSLKPKSVWRVNPDGELRDTFNVLRNVFEMSEIEFFSHYVKDADSDNRTEYLARCRKENDHVRSQLPEVPFSNPWIANQTAPLIPAGSYVHLGILNTLRSWNYFEFQPGVESCCNTGGFGIDGILSTLIGASWAHPETLHFGIIGDLAFFYDMNALGNRDIGNSVRILLVNNGCGTEFKNYNHSAAAFGNDADRYMAAAGHFGNKSKKLVRHFAEDLGFEYMSASTKQEYLSHLDRFVSPEPTDRPLLLEVFTIPEEESAALQAIASTCFSLKREARKILGDKGIQMVKKIMK